MQVLLTSCVHAFVHAKYVIPKARQYKYPVNTRARVENVQVEVDGQCRTCSHELQVILWCFAQMIRVCFRHRCQGNMP